MGVPKITDHIKIKIKIPNTSQEPPVASKAPNEDLEDTDVLCTFKYKIENLNLEHWCIKEQYNAKIQIKMPIPSQEPPSSIENPN